MATEQDRGKAEKDTEEAKTAGEAFASPAVVIRSLRSLRFRRFRCQQIYPLPLFHPRR